MDRREAMPMSGPASFYIQRGMSELQGVRSMSNPGMPFQSNIMGGSSSGPGLVVEPTNTNAGGGVLSDSLGGVGVGMQQQQQNTGPPLRRKRGRPRKYGPDGKVALALSSAATMATPQGITEKRGRGRPPGSGRKQQSAPFGELVSGTAGVGFTPHVITVEAGEV